MNNNDEIKSDNSLLEKQFINEGYKKNPYPFWLWLAITTILLSLLWGGGSWYAKKRSLQLDHNPFLKVTNREISLFLWQNPSFMRRHVSKKEGYLPGFKVLEKMGMEPSFAEELVEAPPQVLFLYHTWNRLLKQEFSPRPIPSKEFAEFLIACEEWGPKKWENAPPEYLKMFENFTPLENTDLQKLSLTTLPLEVRMAFQGWKNYTKEGEAINAINPKTQELIAFLKAHPNYRRSLWRNIADLSGKEYLVSLETASLSQDQLLPKEQIPPFLRVAYYNWFHQND